MTSLGHPYDESPQYKCEKLREIGERGKRMDKIKQKENRTGKYCINCLKTNFSKPCLCSLTGEHVIVGDDKFKGVVRAV